MKLKNGLTKGMKRIFVTIDADLHWRGVIQAEHTQEFFAVDVLMFVSDRNIEILLQRQGYEILNLLEGTQVDFKLLHNLPPMLYKIRFFDYNNLVGY
jgi:hypothetical protein